MRFTGFLAIVSITLGSFVFSACAVTVGLETHQCPVCKEQISVLELVSWGSYIYDWPSKYDLIYAPYNDPQFVWICPQCGYAQVAKYFSDISQDQSESLKAFLGSQWKPKSPNDITADTRFEQAILVNKFLEKDEDFWTWFYRVLICYYRQADPERAKDYARAEIELLMKNKGHFEIPEKSREYLLGEYNRLVGNDDLARRYLIRALRTDPLSASRRINKLTVTAQVGLFVSVLVLWILGKPVGAAKTTVAIAITVLFVLCSLILFLLPYLMQRQQEFGHYYDRIIQDRIELISSKSH